MTKDTKTCLLASCSEVFIPRNSLQKYCNPKHGRKASNDARGYNKTRPDTAGRHLVKLRRGTHKVWFMGCTHFGAPGMDMETFKRHHSRAKKEKWRVVHLGDVCEAVIPSWRAADTNNLMEQTLTPNQQIAEAAKWLDQVQFDAAVQGNHDDRFIKDFGGNVWEDVVFPRLRNQDPKYLGYTGYLTYRIGQKDVIFVLNHMASGGQANQANAANRLRSANEGADVYAGGQNHKGYFESLRVRTPEGDRPVYYMRTGSYLYSASYADAANYPAGGDVGSWVVTISGGGVEGFEWLC